MLDAGPGGWDEGGYGDGDVAEGLLGGREQGVRQWTPEAAALARTCGFDLLRKRVLLA
ncbi:hypothetical protein [Streptomyces sp. NPDC003697]